MTKESTVYNVGRFIIEDTLRQTAGSIVTRDFLFSLTKEIGKRSRKYFDYTQKVPFVQREKQLHTLIDASLASLTDVFSCEALVGRECKKPKGHVKNGHGWVDYCVLYRDYVFLVELKHAYMSARSGEVSNHVKKLWKEAMDQLNRISNEDREFYLQDAKKLVRCSFLFVPHYLSVGNNPQNIRDLDENHQELCRALKPTVNILWKLHRDMKDKEHEYVDTTEKYLGVSCCSKIYL